MKFRVKCVENGGGNCFTLGKIYEWEDGNFLDDEGFNYNMTAQSSDPSEWGFLNSKFELVDEKTVPTIPKLDINVNLINVKKFCKGLRVASEAVKELAVDLKFASYRVIFNNPATILFVGDKKYVSKVHNEEFDEEKGLLMCLAKANGISHLDLKRLMKKAQRPKKK